MLAAGAVAAWRAPVRILLLFYAAIVPFGSGIAVPLPLPPPFNTLSTLVGLLAALGIGAAIVTGRTQAAAVPALVPVALLFFASAAITYGWSVDRQATADALLVLAALVGLFVVVLLAGLGRDDVDRLGDAIAAGGAAAALYGFYLLLTDGLPVEAAGVARFATAGGVGDNSDPNITAAALVLPLVLAWDRVFSRPGAVRLLWLGGASLLTLGIILTGSRGGLAGAAVAMLVLAAVRTTVPKALGVVVAGAAVFYAVGLAVAPGQTERLTQAGSSGRTSVWELGLSACEDHCLTGAGLGSYLQIHEDKFLTEASAEGFRASLKAHNIWLQAGVETGVLGIVTLAAIFVLTLSGLAAVSRDRLGPPLAGVLGLLVTNAFLGNVPFKYFWLVLIYAGAMGAAERVGARARAMSWLPRAWPRLLLAQWRPAVLAGAVVAIGAAVVVGRLGEPVQYRADALVVASRTTDLGQIDMSELVEAVFEVSGLDGDADLTAPAQELAYEVSAAAATAPRAADAATATADQLVAEFNRVSNHESELRLVDEARASLAARDGGPPDVTTRAAAAAIAGLVGAFVAAAAVAVVRQRWPAHHR